MTDSWWPCSAPKEVDRRTVHGSVMWRVVFVSVAMSRRENVPLMPTSL